MATELEDMVRTEIADIGARIRTLRIDRRWTLDELGSRTSLSKSYLSRLEEGDRQPSIAALLSIATAFGLALNELFGAEQQSDLCVVVKHSATPDRQGNGLFYRPLISGDRPSNIQPIHITVPADRQGDELYRHEGEEWLYVLKGSLCLNLDGEQYYLDAGDATNFDASIPHRLTARNGQDVEIILVACPLPRKLLSSYL